MNKRENHAVPNNFFYFVKVKTFDWIVRSKFFINLKHK